MAARELGDTPWTVKRVCLDRNCAKVLTRRPVTGLGGDTVDLVRKKGEYGRIRSGNTLRSSRFSYRDNAENRFERGVAPLFHMPCDSMSRTKAHRHSLYNGFLSFSLHSVPLRHFEGLRRIGIDWISSSTKARDYIRFVSRVVLEWPLSTTNFQSCRSISLLERRTRWKRGMSRNIATHTSGRSLLKMAAATAMCRLHATFLVDCFYFIFYSFCSVVTFFSGNTWII